MQLKDKHFKFKTFQLNSFLFINVALCNIFNFSSLYWEMLRATREGGSRYVMRRNGIYYQQYQAMAIIIRRSQITYNPLMHK